MPWRGILRGAIGAIQSTNMTLILAYALWILLWTISIGLTVVVSSEPKTISHSA